MQIFTLRRAAFYLIKSITVRLYLVLMLKSIKKQYRHACNTYTDRDMQYLAEYFPVYY